MTKILLVDEEPVNVELVRHYLVDLGEPVEITLAGSAEEALQTLENLDPDLVLTDLRVPGGGLELVRSIRDAAPFVPVILMTSAGSERLAVRALRAGAASYVPKIDLKEDLAETVERVLEVAEADRSRNEILGFLGLRETRFELVNDVRLITPLAIYFQDSLEKLGFGTHAVRTQIGIALMEAVSNAMVRGNLEVGSELRRTDRAAYDALLEQRLHQKPYCERKVHCSAFESVNGVCYQIRDEGPGFDPATLPDPTREDNLLAVSGRGLMLMRTFMDAVQHNESGNCVTMTKGQPSAAMPCHTSMPQGA